jgi:flagellar basal-body rod modification protein FlgD
MSDYFNTINSVTASSTGTTTTDSKDDAIMGKDDFMMLLVAQLKNQDPLNPDDPTEFTAQLAQFSSLEQLYNLNESMESMAASNAESDKLATLGTIGKDVAYESETINYSGEEIEIGYNLDSTASSVEIALEMDGATVATLNGEGLTAGNHFVTWDGLTNDGDPAPVGEYTISITATASAGETVMVTPLVKSEVTGVDLEGEGGGTLVTVAGEIAFSKIIGVFEPGTRVSSGTGSATASDDEEESEEESLVDSIGDTAESIEESAEAVEETVEDITS